MKELIRYVSARLTPPGPCAKVRVGEYRMHDQTTGEPAVGMAAPRLLQELGETLQRLRLGGQSFRIIGVLAPKRNSRQGCATDRT